MSDPKADQGRALLAEWKAQHVEWFAHARPRSFCTGCQLDWPCPTSRLIAAVERLMVYVDEEASSECYVICGCQDGAIETLDDVARLLVSP